MFSKNFKEDLKETQKRNMAVYHVKDFADVRLRMARPIP
jgi:hypothetical protein